MSELGGREGGEEGGEGEGSCHARAFCPPGTNSILWALPHSAAPSGPDDDWFRMTEKYGIRFVSLCIMIVGGNAELVYVSWLMV